MKSDSETLIRLTDCSMETWASSSISSGSPRHFYRWILCALACACLAVPAQATMTNLTFQPSLADPNCLNHGLPANPVFVQTGLNYALQLASGQFQTLDAYIANADDTASDLDSDLNFPNDEPRFTTALTSAPAMGALYPVASLFAAVACTHILRRHRSARLEAIVIADR